MFQAQIQWNKFENKAVKMHSHKRFKIDVLGMSHGRHPTDVFSGRFECPQQRLTFKYFTQHMWLVTSSGRLKDVTM